MVGYSSNSSTIKAETEKFQVYGWPQLHSKTLPQTTGGGCYMHYSNLVICIPQNLYGLLDFLFIHIWGKSMVPVWGREQFSELSFLSTIWVQQAWWPMPLPDEQSHQPSDMFPIIVLVHSPLRWSCICW